MTYHFVIAIRGKVPVLVSGPKGIVSDNTDYTLELLPDAEWDGIAVKTVHYVFDDGTTVLHPIVGNNDRIPIVRKEGSVYIGVSAGELKTTKSLAIPIWDSVRRKEGDVIRDPEPDVYERLTGILDDHEKRISGLEETGGSGGGVAFTPGNALELTEDGTLNVKTTNEAEPDNTLPITSAGVNTIVGNIGALLDTI